MASTMDTATFFSKGTPEQYENVLNLYNDALRLKAELKNKKPEELIKLDNWFQNDLPKMIKSRGKDRHLVHDELVQAMKWKLARGKFYPQLSYLIKVNTPRAVMAETKRAFRKLPNLEGAITALSNLKGVGTTMASALLAAAAPEEAPFMADECLMAIPDFEGIDYTTKEYLNFVQHIRNVVERLNKESSSESAWNPHRVELALWTHYIVAENKPELFDTLTAKNGNSHHTKPENGILRSKPEDASSDDANSKDSPAQPIIVSPEDSLLEPPTEDSMDAVTLDESSQSQECLEAKIDDSSCTEAKDNSSPETKHDDSSCPEPEANKDESTPTVKEVEICPTEEKKDESEKTPSPEVKPVESSSPDTAKEERSNEGENKEEMTKMEEVEEDKKKEIDDSTCPEAKKEEDASADPEPPAKKVRVDD